MQQAEQAGDEAKVKEIEAKIDNFETHVVPIIADIDAGFGNEEATYLLTKQMIEAGACAIQIENQVSDAKQCGHQAGKVTVPHEDFLAKINAVRYAFLELGVDEGVIVARTDSEGADLTQKSQSAVKRAIWRVNTSAIYRPPRLTSVKPKKMKFLSSVTASYTAQLVCHRVYINSVKARSMSVWC